MKPSLWGLGFAAVVMVSNPGVDVPLSHTPTLALAMGSLAIVMSWLATVRRTTLARSPSYSLHPSATK